MVTRAVIVLARVGSKHRRVDADEDDVETFPEVIGQSALRHLLLAHPVEPVGQALGGGPRLFLLLEVIGDSVALRRFRFGLEVEV